MSRLRHQTAVVLFTIVAVGVPSSLPAQDRTPPASSTSPATTRSTTSPAASLLTAIITGVDGLVQVRVDESSPWQTAAVGMPLTEGAEFRTGPRSAVRFEIPPGHTITLDRLGTMKLVEAVRDRGRVKTDMGMRYGRVRYDVEEAGIEHDATIHSPGSTLAVRGTQVSLYDQPPFTPQAVSLTGRAEFRNLRRQVVAFGGTRRVVVRGEDDAPARTALFESSIRDAALAQNEQQLRELAYLFAHQGEVFGNVAFSTRRVTDAELPGLLTGRLNFVLRWSEPEGADLNLQVVTPGEGIFGQPPYTLSLFPTDPSIRALLDPILPQSVPSGGRLGLNHIGPEGFETASWPSTFPTGQYSVGAANFIALNTAGTTGQPRVAFKIETFLDGMRQPMLLNPGAAFAGKEPCRFGLVFEDEIALSEVAVATFNIGVPYPCDQPTIKPAKPQGRAQAQPHPPAPALKRPARISVTRKPSPTTTKRADAPRRRRG